MRGDAAGAPRGLRGGAGLRGARTRVARRARVDHVRGSTTSRRQSVTLELSGPRAPQVLARSCALNPRRAGRYHPVHPDRRSLVCRCARRGGPANLSPAGRLLPCSLSLDHPRRNRRRPVNRAPLQDDPLWADALTPLWVAASPASRPKGNELIRTRRPGRSGARLAHLRLHRKAHLARICATREIRREWCRFTSPTTRCGAVFCRQCAHSLAQGVRRTLAANWR